MADALSASIFIGETVSGGTSGSILYIDANGKAAQNNASFLWDNTKLAISLGNPDPGSGLIRIHNYGISNTFLGFNAGNFTLTAVSLVSGYSNTGLGVSALAELTTGYNNTAVAFALPHCSTGFNNTAVGDNACQTLTTGTYCTAVGFSALQLNVTASNCTAVGATALGSKISGISTAVGRSALLSETTGTGNAALGDSAMSANVSGNGNTGIGSICLQNITSSFNTGVGYNAGATLTTGQKCTFLGYLSDTSSAAGIGRVAIGYLAVASADFTIQLGAASGVNACNINWGLGGTGGWLNLGTATAAVGAGDLSWSNQAKAPNGTIANPSYAFSSDLNSGFRWTATPSVDCSIAATLSLSISQFGSGTGLSVFNNAGQLATTIAVDGTDFLSIQRGGHGQTFRIYGTTNGAKYLSLAHDGTNAFLTSTAGQIAFGSAALATNATVNFPCAASSAGTPTGVPASIPTGQIPWEYDSTNDIVNFYNGSWKGIAAGKVILGAEKTSDQTITNSTVLTDDTALTVNVLAGKTYFFRFVIFQTSASVTAGIKLSVNGTCTATSIKFQGIDIAGTPLFGRGTSLGATVGLGVGTGDNFLEIEGSIEVNAAGTLKLQWAQNTADAVNGTTVQRNSYMECVQLV